jgi:hypothetical protein
MKQKIEGWKKCPNTLVLISECGCRTCLIERNKELLTRMIKDGKQKKS